MQHLGAGIEHQIAHFDPQSEKAFKVARNNAAFEAAVRQAWADNPDAAEYLLAHTNSLFFAKDEALRKGAGKDVDRYVMGVYLDDPMARSELNARREVLTLFLMRAGLRFDELRIIPATMGMRERRLYPHAVERLERIFGARPAEKPAWQPSAISQHDIDAVCGQVEDAQLAQAIRDAMGAYASCDEGGGEASAASSIAPISDSEEVATVRRAFCLAVGDLDYAQTLLSQASRITLDLCVNPSSHTPSRFRKYRCTFHVPNPELFSRLVRPYEESIIARARELDLHLSGISVRQVRA